ncbi:hypothetical protein [Mycobacterium camsae]|uniref:hypothetical protein n=1 Tax=Mycobacterium gordonae TaxID=1778 RepID=UPI00197ED1C8|nr:hypothetical protein [Mycobacterium gordonae]
MPPRETSAEASASEAGVDDLESDDLAQVEARAEAARTRARELRRQAEEASSPPETDDAETGPSRLRRWRPRRPGRKTLIAAAAILISSAASAGSGYLVWHHHQVVQQTQRSTEFATAARNAVVLMMSIDPTKARADMQRFADQTTGQFKAGVLMGAEDMVRALEQSKVVAKAAVQAVGVQSMTEDSAVVLVAAKSEISKTDQPKPEMRTWRVVVDVEREGSQLKISKIEFVP